MLTGIQINYWSFSAKFFMEIIFVWIDSWRYVMITIMPIIECIFLPYLKGLEVFAAEDFLVKRYQKCPSREQDHHHYWPLLHM
jgi:hypothetical protein